MIKPYNRLSVNRKNILTKIVAIKKIYTILYLVKEQQIVCQKKSLIRDL